MIKILFYIEELEGGGAEKVLRTLVNHMDQNQFEITVQTAWPYNSAALLKQGIIYKPSFASDNHLNRLKYRMEMQLGLFYRLHLRGNYDIECAYLEMGPTKALASSTNKKAKKLAWVHCDLNRLLQNPSEFRKKTEKWYRAYDEIICVSEDVKKSFRDLFGDSYPTRVLSNVIDEAEIWGKSKEPLPDSLRKRKLTVASLGRLTYPKGYDVLLRVHHRLIKEGFDYDLWIAGEGEERSALERFVRENDLEDSTYLPGFIQNPYPILAFADLLVCSSRFEGISTFATEGIVLGKALVTTDCTGMRELLGDSEYGLVVEADEESLYQGMRRMLSSRALREHYSHKAAERSRDISAEKLTADTESFFESLAIQS